MLETNEAGKCCYKEANNVSIINMRDDTLLKLLAGHSSRFMNEEGTIT